MKLARVLAIALTANPTSCKPAATDATLNAIVSRDGTDAVALIPGRRHFTTSMRSSAFENSIRMVLMPVKCAPMSILKLELLSALDPELVRHDGRRVVDAFGKPIPGAESCTLFGEHMVHPWAMDDLFFGMPKTQEQFDDQQWVWLALRGRYNGEASLPAGVKKVFEEAGYLQGEPEAITRARTARWDTLFNPCSPVDSAQKFSLNKTRLFECADGNYRPTDSVDLKGRLSRLIAKTAKDLLSRIAAGGYDHLKAEGIDRAISLASVSVGQGLSLANPPRVPLTATVYRPQFPTPAPTTAQTVPPGSFSGQLVTYEGDSAQYLRQDVTELMARQGYGGGGQYRTEMMTGSNGQTYYVDRYASGENSWYQRTPAGAWTHVGTTGRPGDQGTLGTVQGTTDVRNSTSHEGWQIRDVTQQMRSEGYTDLASSRQWINPTTGESQFTDIDNQGNVSRWTRGNDGSFSRIMPVETSAAATVGDQLYYNGNLLHQGQYKGIASIGTTGSEQWTSEVSDQALSPEPLAQLEPEPSVETQN